MGYATISSITDINGWYTETLAPIFGEISKIMAREGEKNDVDLLFGHWWAIFVKNTVALLELIPQFNQSYQINMTIRLLMEMAADVEFMDKNRANIKRHNARFDDISNEAERLGGMTYGQLAVRGKNFHMFHYDGDKKLEEANTTQRVKEAYSKADFNFYDYLSCFTHLNHLGMMYDLNISKPERINEALRDRIYLIQFYPTIFEKEVHAIGNLCEIEELKNYDCNSVRKAFAYLASHCQYESARVVPPSK